MVVAICGDAVVGRALVLLLRGSRYDARFLPCASLVEPGALEGVRLLLLAPMWEFNAERRKALLASLRAAASAAGAPILELRSSVGEGLNGEALVGPEHVVPWPCTPEELERRIEAALIAGADGPPRAAASGGEGA
jgi:hypothetical protein